MARGLLSHRVATLAAVAACLVILDGQAAATAPQQPCEAEEGGHCPSAADELDEASLLMRGAATKAHDHAAAAAAADANATAKCNEIKFQGLCYRTCTDMGAMEPRRSSSNCGGVNDYNFIQRCNADGSSTVGSGSAPGLSGRPTGGPTHGCFGDDSASLPSKKAPNMCTMDCKRGAPSTKAEGCKAKLLRGREERAAGLEARQGSHLLLPPWQAGPDALAAEAQWRPHDAGPQALQHGLQ